MPTIIVNVERFFHAAAKGHGVTRKALSELVNGHCGASPEMAVRLSKAFGGTPETWLGLQMQYDLWQAERRASSLLHHPGQQECLCCSREALHQRKAMRNGIGGKQTFKITWIPTKACGNDDRGFRWLKLCPLRMKPNQGSSGAFNSKIHTPFLFLLAKHISLTPVYRAERMHEPTIPFDEFRDRLVADGWL